jgi:hypothetical protein
MSGCLKRWTSPLASEPECKVCGSGLDEVAGCWPCFQASKPTTPVREVREVGSQVAGERDFTFTFDHVQGALQDYLAHRAWGAMEGNPPYQSKYVREGWMACIDWLRDHGLTIQEASKQTNEGAEDE